MDSDWLSFDPDPKKPEYVPPAGAVDAHCHVFGPAERFPFSPQRKYTPCDAPKEKLFELRDFLGFERNVIVQATCHGTDNRALVDALKASRGLARGVACVEPDIGGQELKRLHEAGVRGVRLNFLPRLVEPASPEILTEIASRIQPLGWHVVLYFEAAELPRLWPEISRLTLPVVIDHMGRPDVRLSVDGPEFGLFQRLIEQHGNIYTKVSCPERLSRATPPSYEDVVPFAHRLVERFPHRVLWGTDWPHPNMKSHMPNDGDLVDFIPRIAPGAESQRRLLVDNPMQLYWPDLAGR